MCCGRTFNVESNEWAPLHPILKLVGNNVSACINVIKLFVVPPSLLERQLVPTYSMRKHVDWLVVCIVFLTRACPCTGHGVLSFLPSNFAMNTLALADSWVHSRVCLARAPIGFLSQLDGQVALVTNACVPALAEMSQVLNLQAQSQNDISKLQQTFRLPFINQPFISS